MKKPSKPTPLYGLRPHANGKYYKWIKGIGNKYFGRWDDPDAADRAFGRCAAQINQGQEPTPDPMDITVAEVVDRFISHQQARLDRGDIQLDYFHENRQFAFEFADVVGGHLRVEELNEAILERFGAYLRKRCSSGHARNNRLMIVRAMFRWAREDADLIRSKWHRHHLLEKIPPATIRQERDKFQKKHGSARFSKKDCRVLLSHAKGPIYPMMLLALNCGMSQREVAALEWNDLDLGRGVMRSLRPKTKIKRDASLWPVTVDALRQYKSRRPEPHDPQYQDRVFITKYGNPFAYTRINREPDGAIKSIVRVESVSWEFRRLLQRVDKATGEADPLKKMLRPRRNFRGLRRTFRTAAEGNTENPMRRNAVNRIMGHELLGMDDHYVAIPMKRLRRITDSVFAKLFGGWSCQIKQPADVVGNEPTGEGVPWDAPSSV